MTDQAASPAGAATHAGKCLTFVLGEELYGLEILKVREIIGLMDISRVLGAMDMEAIRETAAADLLE